jgi:hypothetical protein
LIASSGTRLQHLREDPGLIVSLALQPTACHDHKLAAMRRLPADDPPKFMLDVNPRQMRCCIEGSP